MKLGLTNLDSDLSFYFNHHDSEPSGILATYVDYIINAGDDECAQITEKIEKRLETKPRIYDDFHFAGLHIWRDDDGTVHINQTAHFDRLKSLGKG